jgi:biopolymer transport protein ExbD
MQLRYRRKRRVTIDISAMIDVVFLLLLFFLVTTTFLESPGINLDLPEAKSSTSQQREQLTLMIDKNRRMFFNNEPITKNDFEPILAKALKEDATKTLVIQADQKTDYGLVVFFMDVARILGVKNLVIETRPLID